MKPMVAFARVTSVAVGELSAGDLVSHARPWVRPANRSGEGGFTLLEMLIATAMLVTITAAVFSLMDPVEGRFRTQPESADVQQRLRVAVDSLTRDLLMAGAGPYVPPSPGPLLDYLAPVLPYRAGFLQDDPAAGVFHRPDAITVVYVPSTPSQTMLRDPLASDAAGLTLDTQPNCPPPTPGEACGFRDGVRAALLDLRGLTDIVTVTDVQEPMVLFDRGGPLSGDYAPGAPFARVETHTYYLKSDRRANTHQLMHYDGYRSDLPVVDNVVALEFAYWGDSQPPTLLPGKSLADPVGPYTTYGPRPPMRDADNVFDLWPTGENCVFSVSNGQQVPRLPALAAGAGLVSLPAAILTDGPWCPDAQHAHRFDADLLRIRRIRVRLRVQAGLALLRGPAGILFRNGGMASSPDRVVPDQEVAFDVTPRNMNLDR